jgi:hypothetical protein
VAETGLLVQRAVYAGLDALESILALDLCAFVHVSEGFGPQLYLRTPNMKDLDPSEAFSLFSSLRDLLEPGAVTTEMVEVAGYGAALARASSGLRSRSICVVGRRNGFFEAAEVRTVTALCDASGAATHAIEEAGGGEIAVGSIRIALQVGDGLAKAEVSLPSGTGEGTGRGEAVSSMVAVAEAAIAAIDPTLKLGAATDDQIDGERAVLVLVRNADGRIALGSALCGDDPLQATARAAVEAATRLH